VAATSRASDALMMRIQRLTVEEYGAIGKGDDGFLGFKKPSGDTFTQRYTAENIRVKGERLPLAGWPAASFGGEKGFGEYPVVIRDTSFGNRSSLGYWGVVGVGREERISATQGFDWTIYGGGYTKRGPATGFEVALVPKRPKDAAPDD